MSKIKTFISAHKRPTAIFIIIAAALLLELTLFNRAYYAHLWQDAESADFETVSMTYENGVYRKAPIAEGEEPEPPAFIFYELDRRVNSVYVEPADGAERAVFHVVFRDDGNNRRQTPSFEVLSGAEFSWYQEINPYGEVDYIRIEPETDNFAVKSVAVNKTIPFQFVPTRFLFVVLLAVGIYLLITCDLRKILFDGAARYQKAIFASVIMLFVAFGGLVVFSEHPPDIHQADAYDRMAESLARGRLDLEISEEDMGKLAILQVMEDPYNPTARGELGVQLWEFDNSYYDGKIYMQHGIGPVLISFLPYYLMTGSHLSVRFAIFMFGVLAAAFIALLWRSVVAKYFPKTPFIMFMCSTVALMNCSLVTTQFFWIVKHSVAVTSGIMFSALGLWQLFSAANHREQGSFGQYIQIFAGCFFTAYAVSCRASTALISFLVPVILWRLVWEQRLKQIILVFTAAAVPYLAVALPLMWYNYARFDSIFEFGTGYVLTLFNNTYITDLNPAALVKLTLEAFRGLLFEAVKIIPVFPFVQITTPLAQAFDASSPHRHYNGFVGMISFPVFWSLVFFPIILRYSRKEPLSYPKPIIRLSIAMFSVGAVTAIIDYVLVASIVRYQVDYMFLLVLPALVVCYLTWEHFGRSSRFCKVACAACIISALIALPLTSENNTLWNLSDETRAELKRMFTFF